MSIRNPLASHPREGHEFATLGGGCFWCLEAVYEEVEGVVDVESGYAGGHDTQPTYAKVCGGGTGHAEVVRIEFDPKQVSYREILEIFFAIHDPTQLDRQGNDVGTQYRSVIFVHSDDQRRVAQQVIEEAGSQWPAPVVTQLLPSADYYRAETSHQEYFRHNTAQSYCLFIVAPKLQKFRKTFASKRRKSARD